MPSTSNSTIRLRALERKPNWDKLLLNNIVKTMFGVQYEFFAVFSRNRDVLWSSRTMISTSGVQSRLVTIDILIFLVFRQPGVVAHACNPVTWRLVSLNGLRAGFLGVIVLCRSGVRAKFGVNMVSTEESEFFRLVKEERTGPGWKHSRLKLPRQTVAR